MQLHISSKVVKCGQLKSIEASMQGKGKVNVNCLEYKVGTNNMEGQFWGGQCACVEQSWKMLRTMSDNSVAVNPQPGGLRHPPFPHLLTHLILTVD